MQPSDAKRFRELLRGMGRMYGQEPDALTLDAYWVALKCWNLLDFEAACAQLMQTAKFMPRPAEFNELRKAGEISAGEAWAEVLEYVRGGGEDSADWGDQPRVVAAVRAIGGFRSIGMINSDQLQFLERRFAEHYETIGEREDIREALPQIAGSPRLSPPKALPYDPKRRLS